MVHQDIDEGPPLSGCGSAPAPRRVRSMRWPRRSWPAAGRPCPTSPPWSGGWPGPAGPSSMPTSAPWRRMSRQPTSKPSLVARTALKPNATARTAPERGSKTRWPRNNRPANDQAEPTGPAGVSGLEPLTGQLDADEAASAHPEAGSSYQGHRRSSGRLPRPGDVGRQGLGLPTSGGPVPARQQRSAAGAAAHRIAHRRSANPAITDHLAGYPWKVGSGAHPLQGLLGLISTPGHHLCLACWPGSPVRRPEPKAPLTPIDPAILANSIGTLTDQHPDHGRGTAGLPSQRLRVSSGVGTHDDLDGNEVPPGQAAPPASPLDPIVDGRGPVVVLAIQLAIRSP